MMTLQQLLSHTRKAVDTFSMIEDGDRIAIGVSGGKDSLTLALALKGLQRFYPKHFELQAFTISLGFPGTDFSPVADFMAAHDIPYQVIESDIGEIVFEQRKEKNPCALCAKMRKGAFNDAVKAAGCNKVALGHHKEDAVETFLMSLLYEGRINTFSPVTYWDRIGLYSIFSLCRSRTSYTLPIRIICRLSKILVRPMGLPSAKKPNSSFGNGTSGSMERPTAFSGRF